MFLHLVFNGVRRLELIQCQISNIFDQRESRLNAEIAAQQQRLADASKRDSTSMKTLSLLGAVFLPGTFLSSMFSMPFFNFDAGELL